MLSGNAARWMSREWRDFVRPHEQRITDLSGQVFGAAYVDGVQIRTDVRLDSSPPIAAMLAAEASAGKGVEMIKQLQSRYYVQGQPIAERDTLNAAAREIGLDESAFGNALEAVSSEQLRDHFQANKAQMERLQATGFPTFALEKDGQWEVLHLGRYLGQPEKFQRALKALLS
ncbi:DsbA family protein [Pseudomonas ceruminis]|uniref:DsbA family protein n=1 Tax=Pseudomonas putida group TaxID=136845 RepID=UPI003D035685